MSGNIQYSKTCLLLLGLVCAGALFARMEGIKWPKLHPDEPVIGGWIAQSAHSVYIKDRVYPNGFFTLARPFIFTSRALVRLGEHFAYHCGEIDRIRSLKPDGIYFGRWFNVWAGTLLCVMVFLLVARMARSQWAGLFAAGLIGFAQYAVEHSHYAEIDMAALLTLTFALWLWVVAGDTGRRRWFIAAALASGFAAGTKFTLMALGPIVLIEAVLLAKQRFPGDWWKRAVGLSCLGFLLFGVGFVVANPAVLLDFKWFWAGLAAEKRRVFAETALNLGPLGINPTVRYLHHFWCLHFYAQTLGYPWIVLLAAGLPCMAFGFLRRYWTVLFLFPLLYAVYWLFMAPWVRSQEFLLFLPSFAAIAALPLIVLWRTKNYFIRAVALMIAVLAITANGYNGLRVSALFGWKDTRLMASEWLQIRLPPESMLAAESYAEAACLDTGELPLSINKIERCGLAPLVARGADYLLRTSGISGRGLRHPLTGELYPEPAGLFQQFLGASELLCAWAPLPPPGLATFVSPAIKLYGLKHFTPTASLHIALSQPALIVNSDQNPVGRQTFFPIGHGLGCAVCLLIDRLPQTIAIGGPDQLTKPVYLVLNTVERPAIINVRGFGSRHRIALDPYDTMVVPLKRPAWRPRAKSFETITLKAEPVEDVLYIPCFARIAFTVNEAARIFLDTGREDKISEYFPEELLEQELNPDLQYIISAKLGRRQMTERNKQSAVYLQKKIEKCLQAAPASVSVNGVSGYYYEQFARVRLQQPYEFAGGQWNDESTRSPLPHAVKILDLQLPENQEGKTAEYVQVLTIPALIAGGRRELRGDVMLRLKETETKTDSTVPLTMLLSDGTDAANKIDLQPGQWRDFSLPFHPGREVQPCLEVRAPVAGQVHLRNMEIVWSLTSALEAVGHDLAAAAGGHDGQRTEPDKTAGGLAQEMKGNLKNPPVFKPWLALVGFSFNSGTREARCVFEALRNDTPGLAATFWLRRRGEWRRKQVQPLTAGTQLSKGERVVMVVRLNDAFARTPDLNKLALGIETDVQWHAGAIPLATGGSVVPFSRLSE